MSSTYDISIKISDSNKVFKQIKESVNFSSSNLRDYITILRSTQKAVNSALTEIVDQEKSNGTIAGDCMEEDDDEDSDVDERPVSTAKRKITCYKNNKKLRT